MRKRCNCPACIREQGVPTEAENPTDAAVLIATVRVGFLYATMTVRDIANMAELPISTTYSALLRLRDRGLVSWDPARNRTLRPRVAVVLVDGVNR